MKKAHLFASIALAVMSIKTAVAEPLTGEDIAQKVWNRDIGDARINKLNMILVNKSGQQRQRTAKSFATDTNDISKTAIYFTSPSAIADTAFLSWDYEASEGTDKQWLFLPATQRTRTIPASERGDAFMGTDFSYEDIKSNLRLDLDDYSFKMLDTKTKEGKTFYTIEAIPVNQKVAQELGYSKGVAEVDSSNWLITKVIFSATNGTPLKEVYVKESRQIDGIWTATNIQAMNLQTGHSTIFELSDVTYQDALDDDIFDKDSIEFGAPDYD